MHQKGLLSDLAHSVGKKDSYGARRAYRRLVRFYSGEYAHCETIFFEVLDGYMDLLEKNGKRTSSGGYIRID